LGVIPILALLLSHQLSIIRKSKIWIISAWILVGLTVIYQVRGVELLARQKNLNSILNQRVSQLEDTLVVTDLWWLPCDLARTWDTHRFFYSSSEQVFRDLLYHMKASGNERFVYISESPASLVNTSSPITVAEHLEWDGGERAPVVVERIILNENNDAWAEVANQVGMAQTQARNFERALLPFVSSVRWKPDDPDAWYRLGAVKLQMWDEDGARDAFENALEIDPTHQYSLKALRRWRNEVR
jgi:tetratricopeptide (TPR) repeat protein